MVLCDMCDQPKKCTSREIEGREYDICADCWRPLAMKLAGKGRNLPDVVLLPPAIAQPEAPSAPQPGEPPKIWGRACPQ
jgi:hypothetical protein